jgi:hypothetical protein
MTIHNLSTMRDPKDRADTNYQLFLETIQLADHAALQEAYIAGCHYAAYRFFKDMVRLMTITSGKPSLADIEKHVERVHANFNDEVKAVRDRPLSGVEK